MGLEPWVEASVRVLCHWQRMVCRGHCDSQLVSDYWDTCQVKGTPRGPIHVVAQLANKLGIELRGGVYLQGTNRTQHIAELFVWKARVTLAATKYVWAWLSRTRYHFEGLAVGKDPAADLLMSKLKGQKSRRQWQMIQADGIFTPWRAHQRDQGPPQWPACSAPRKPTRYSVPCGASITARSPVAPQDLSSRATFDVRRYRPDHVRLSETPSLSCSKSI
jgi:hypothetical protein